jgi:hypothetical protein
MSESFSTAVGRPEPPGNDIEELADRQERYWQALANQRMLGLEASIERENRAAELARLRMRMRTVEAELAAIDETKAKIEARIAGASPVMAACYRRQVAMLGNEQIRRLQELGLDEGEARAVVQAVAGQLSGPGAPALAAPADIGQDDEEDRCGRVPRRGSRTAGNGQARICSAETE